METAGDAMPTKFMPAEELKVEEEEKDELLDKILVEIENAHLNESDLLIADPESEEDLPAQDLFLKN